MNPRHLVCAAWSPTPVSSLGQRQSASGQFGVRPYNRHSHVTSRLPTLRQSIQMKSGPLPFWLRIVLVASAVCIAIGASLFAYQYYTRPTTLTLAVGSLDGETS